jgi:hypothetical protein
MLRRLLIVAALLWPGFAPAQIVGPPNEVLCNKVVTFTNASAATSLVAAASRTKVLVCGWAVTNTAASGTVTFNYGTKTSTECDTATVALTPALSVAVTSSLIDHQPYAREGSATGSGLCVTPSATTISGVVYYTTVSTPQ